MEAKAKIMVVDDEKRICENVAKILTKNDYEVYHALSAEEALEKMAIESFSLLISDIANATVIAQAAFDVAMTERENLVTDDGKVSQALATYAKWSAIKRSGLLALRQFQRRKAGAKIEPTLADVIIETSDQGAEP